MRRSGLTGKAIQLGTSSETSSLGRTRLRFQGDVAALQEPSFLSAQGHNRGNELTPECRSDGEVRPKDVENTGRKKPYNKPSFRFESVFETMALSCGKIVPSQAGCKLNRKNS
jgi:hypothetical protein